MGSAPKYSEKRLKIAALLIALIVSIGVGEIFARALFNYQLGDSKSLFFENLFGANQSLDDYEVNAENHSRHWRLRAGFQATVREVMDSKIKAGKSVGASSEADDELMLRINSAGFRGPDIKEPKQGQRVLILGDSVTFGSIRNSYPEIARRALAENGYQIEILNGGVEGYSARNLEIELERYISIKPDMVLIKIGWNNLFSTVPFKNVFIENSKLIWLVSRAWDVASAYLQGHREAAMNLYERAKKPVFDSPQLDKLEDFEPDFLAPVARMVKRLTVEGIPVVMMTLPGLFHEDVKFESRALLLAHLPRFTDNPIVLMRLTTLYNQSIRNFAEKNGLKLIDLAKWSTDGLVPRHLYYTDSVHFTDDGLERLGAFVAQQLVELLMLENGG